MLREAPRLQLLPRALRIRFAIAAVVASAVATLIVLPLSRFTVGVIDVALRPVLPLQLFVFGGPGDYVGHPPRIVYWTLAWQSAVCAIPVYVGLLYIPNLLRRFVPILWRLVRIALRSPSRLCLYAISGGVAGAFVGLRIWEGYAARIGLVPFVLGVVLAIGLAIGPLGSIVPTLMALRTPRNIP